MPLHQWGVDQREDLPGQQIRKTRPKPQQVTERFRTERVSVSIQDDCEDTNWRTGSAALNIEAAAHPGKSYHGPLTKPLPFFKRKWTQSNI